MSRPDVITDLSNEDKIDLKGIDANSKVAGDQAFSLVSAFSGAAGQATWKYDAGHDLTVLSLDVNGDRAADMVVQALGNHADFNSWVW